MTGAGPSGLIVIDKPTGITSHGVVGRIRRAMDTRRVGHAGTLDPMATGVLIVGVGRATRLLGHLALQGKDYEATIRLGATTVTDDREGDVLHIADPTALGEVSDAQILAGVSALTGEIDQVPTAISAIKVDGKRSHARVRAGEEVQLSARRVVVERFDVVGISRIEGAIDLEVVVTCSTGTYVRALARDLGASLGVGGHLTSLRRTRVGGWHMSDAWPLEQIVDAPDPRALLTDLDVAARSSFPLHVVDAAGATWVRNGRPLRELLSGDLVETTALLDPDGGLLALVGPGDRGPTYLAVFSS